MESADVSLNERKRKHDTDQGDIRALRLFHLEEQANKDDSDSDSDSDYDSDFFSDDDL